MKIFAYRVAGASVFRQLDRSTEGTPWKEARRGGIATGRGDASGEKNR